MIPGAAGVVLVVRRPPGVVQTQPWVAADAELIPVPGVRLIANTGMSPRTVADHVSHLRAAGKIVTLTLNTALLNVDEWGRRVEEVCSRAPDLLIEVWNEPRPEVWSRYWHYLRRASEVIRSYGGRVCLGGQPPAQAEVFWRAAAHHNVFDLVDAVGLHPYMPTPALQIAYVASRRLQLSELAVRLPLVLTEFGWGTGTGTMAVSEATQADYLARSFDNFDRKANELGIERAHWFSYRDWPGGANWDHHAGVLTADGKRKPAYHSLLEVAR